MGDAPGEHQDVLGNETPEAITSAFWTGLEVLTQYGWFILLGIALVLYLWPKFQAYRDRSQEKRENEMLKKYDENSATSRLEAMERSRLRMQESHNSQVEHYQEQEKVKEETKRQQKIEEWEKHKRGAGYHNKYKPAEEQVIPASSASVINIETNLFKQKVKEAIEIYKQQPTVSRDEGYHIPAVY